MPASSRRMIELSFLALLDSGIDYRGRKVGSFAAGTLAEAPSHVRPTNFCSSVPFHGGLTSFVAARTAPTTVMSGRRLTRLRTE